MTDDEEDGPHIVVATAEPQLVEQEPAPKVRAKRIANALSDLRRVNEARLELYRAMARSRLN